MATKAEMFRAEAQRTRHQPPRVKKPHRLTDPHHTDTRNLTKRIDKESGMALEDSMTGRPSRKSTRTSSNHGRSDTAIMKAVMAQKLTPTARAQRAQAARRK